MGTLIHTVSSTETPQRHEFCRGGSVLEVARLTAVLEGPMGGGRGVVSPVDRMASGLFTGFTADIR